MGTYSNIERPSLGGILFEHSCNFSHRRDVTINAGIDKLAKKQIGLKKMALVGVLC